MVNNAQIKKIIKSLGNVRADYPFGEHEAAYKVNDVLFAIVNEDKSPIRISLRCDPKLSSVLREKYIEVMPGYHLSKKHWNTIVLSGQLDIDEIRGLITHSYELALKED